MKQAIFTVVDNGVEGKSPDRVVFACTGEQLRDNWFDNSKNKNFYRKVDVVADLDEVAKKAWNRLDGLEQLSLLRPSCSIWRDATHPDIEATT